MPHNWAKGTDLLHRLDPQFYSTQNMRDAALIDRSCNVPLDTLRDPQTVMSYGVLKPDFVDGDGYRIARLQNFRDPFLDLDDCARITKEKFLEFKRSECSNGDLLIAIAGYVGSVGLVSALPSHVRLNINQHIARFRQASPPKVDVHYLATYLISGHGKRQTQRWVSGSVQAGINLSDLRTLPIPYPHATVQDYIGAKVRQADRLRSKSGRLEQQFTGAIAAIFPNVAKATGVRRTSLISPAGIGRNLNPGAYWPDRLAVRNHLTSLGAVEISTIADIETEIAQPGAADQAYFGLDAFDSSSCRISPASINEAEVEGTVRVLPEGPVISRLRPYLNKVGYIPSKYAGSAGSTELLCVRPKSGIDGWYVYGVLKLESSLRQLSPLANGSTLPRIDREDVLELLVPMHPQSVALGQLLRDAQSGYFSSEALIQAAKLIVEALIEGKLTEADLLDAAADPSADRTLLARLTRAGLDVAGAAPLFHDPAALDALVADAHAQPAQG